MTQVSVSTSPIEVGTRRIEDGPVVTVASGGADVSATVTPANVSAESETVQVTVSPTIATVQSVVSVPDVSVQVDGPLVVSAATVGIQGPPGTGSGGSSFLPPPDLLDESDATYFYYGWADVNGGWLVRRAKRATAKKEDATTGFPDLATAWPNRVTLNYA